MVKSIKQYNLTKKEKAEIFRQMKDIISSDDFNLFAYLHGSFIEDKPFRDIDIAIYTQKAAPEQLLEYELKLGEFLESKLKIPVDLKVLNYAPVTFCYMVIKKGLKLFIRDDQKRVDFEVRTMQHYLDFLPFRERYLKEA